MTTEELRTKLDQALARENVFRRLGMVVRTTHRGNIHAVAFIGTADWIEDGHAYNERSDTIMKFPIDSY